MTTIRPAIAADAAGIARLVEHYWAIEHIAGFAQTQIILQLAQLLSAPEQGAGWIAVDADGSQIVGYLLAVFVFSLEQGGRTAEIDEFFVIPAQRSAGVGSGLLQMAQRDLRAAGAVHLQLQLNVDNDRGRAFYLREGFEPRAAYELYEKQL